MSIRRIAHRIRRTILVVITFPIWLFLGLVMLIGFTIFWVITAPKAFAGHRNLLRSLDEQGRLGSPGKENGRYKSGTLIVDTCTKANGVLQCWWTPDDIEARSPYEIKRYDHFCDRLDEVTPEHPNVPIDPFDFWVYDRYIHPETGTAILLASHRGERCARRLKEEYPELDVIVTWSALVANIEPANRPIHIAGPEEASGNRPATHRKQSFPK